MKWEQGFQEEYYFVDNQEQIVETFVKENVRVVNLSFSLDLSQTAYASLDKASTLKALDLSTLSGITTSVNSAPQKLA